MVMTRKDIEVARRLALADALKTIHTALHELGAGTHNIHPILETIVVLEASDADWIKTHDHKSR